MVNYPTILGLPQEDIDRQLYVGVLGLESRVKALENKPKPTPTGTGTVTATVLYDETPQIGALVFLCTNDTIPSKQDDSMVVAMGVTDDTGVTTLGIYDSSTHQPTSETAIPYDDYYLIAMDGDGVLSQYDEPFTVDGNETVTITLTEQ